MEQHEKLINKLYSAFQAGDYKQMAACYHPEASFTDEAFVGLNAKEVASMWKMLIQNGKDLQLEYSDVSANETQGKAIWVARYSFGPKKRKVVNRIQANFEFKDGLIYRHRDRFPFYKWARQALGPTGLLLGWTPLLRTKVQKEVRKRLEKFMAKENK